MGTSLFTCKCCRWPLLVSVSFDFSFPFIRIISDPLLSNPVHLSHTIRNCFLRPSSLVWSPSYLKTSVSKAFTTTYKVVWKDGKQPSKPGIDPEMVTEIFLPTLLASSGDIWTEALAVNWKHIHKDFHCFHDYWFTLKHHLLSKEILKLDVKQYKIKLNQRKMTYQLHKFRIYKNLSINQYILISI